MWLMPEMLLMLLLLQMTMMMMMMQLLMLSMSLRLLEVSVPVVVAAVVVRDPTTWCFFRSRRWTMRWTRPSICAQCTLGTDLVLLTPFLMMSEGTVMSIQHFDLSALWSLKQVYEGQVINECNVPSVHSTTEFAYSLLSSAGSCSIEQVGVIRFCIFNSHRILMDSMVYGTPGAEFPGTELRACQTYDLFVLYTNHMARRLIALLHVSYMRVPGTWYYHIHICTNVILAVHHTGTEPGNSCFCVIRYKHTSSIVQ